MNDERPGRIAILFRGAQSDRLTVTPEKTKFSGLFEAFAAAGQPAEPVVYDEDFVDEVRDQLLQNDGVLVWINPIENGQDRSVLDAMLREIAEKGVFVSTHPDMILKLGTKEVLYQTREVGWGSDTRLYRTMDQLREELPRLLADGKVRVLKQFRGNGGDGVWKVELSSAEPASGASSDVPGLESLVRVRHAKRGSEEEEITLGEFFDRCVPYFSNDGRLIDQAYQDRLPEGMIRCYLVQDKVAGFGHQAINALYPAPPGAPATAAPQPGPRYYYPPDKPEFQALKQQLESKWLPEVQELLDIDTDSLPILWDCDFLLGPKTVDGADSFVLCEINVSSVSPFPDSAIPYVVAATRMRVAGK